METYREFMNRLAVGMSLQGEALLRALKAAGAEAEATYDEKMRMIELTVLYRGRLYLLDGQTVYSAGRVFDERLDEDLLVRRTLISAYVVGKRLYLPSNGSGTGLLPVELELALFELVSDKEIIELPERIVSLPLPPWASGGTGGLQIKQWMFLSEANEAWAQYVAVVEAKLE